MTFLKACMENLKLEHESIADFRKGYQQLTEQDKLDLREYFKAEGVAIEG